MTEAGSSAENIVARYHRAWTSGNLDGARALLADDLDFQGSIDTSSRADDFMRR